MNVVLNILNKVDFFLDSAINLSVILLRGQFYRSHVKGNVFFNMLERDIEMA
jgi:hypothetical protein